MLKFRLVDSGQRPTSSSNALEREQFRVPGDIALDDLPYVEMAHLQRIGAQFPKEALHTSRTTPLIRLPRSSMLAIAADDSDTVCFPT